MATRTTVLRNTGVAQQAAAQGKTVSFRYTDKAGVQTVRKNLKVTHVKATRQNLDALLVTTEDSIGNVRTFRTDRMTHGRLGK